MASARSTLESTLNRAWLRRGLLACALWPLARLFGAVLALRRALYRRGWLASVRLPVPVIIVGNVFVGGTGKTPLTIWLVEALRRAGRVPGVISRGYGASAEMPRLVLPDATPQQVGDEPLLIARRAQCPVMVGRDRVAAAQALLSAHPELDCIVSDDGLQHYRLARDVEIVLFDGRGAGNGWLLPAGPLREPATRRRDFTVLNLAQGADLPAAMPADAYRMELTGAVAQRLCDPAQQLPLRKLSVLPGKIAAAAGIGSPARFFATLHQAGLVFDELPLPDHYDFAVNPFADIGADIILITEKDAVKCALVTELKHDPRLWVVPVTAHLDGALVQRILEKCRGHSTA
ncbi:tetraacyldisaccharide 4'-kinase [Herminiimonas sp. CN]|uniref:tetraacyldisaccharide 4'-kinase n=1 Tax=Herminiimonas sp. CN TaxID=1349818 RepID=UPI0004741758|nr:tetraacyldisaccharide 4'-kinase [Herminiimonas sp. CN]